MKPVGQGRVVAYYRVSTARQGRSGLGLEAQREAVRGYLETVGGTVTAEAVEIESGKRADRPKLADALRLCRLHRATLIIARLDRLARNVAFVSALMDAGVEFVAVDFPQANRLTVHILAAVAEHEARMISERTRAALQAAKARGVRLGGNRGSVISAEARARSASVRSDKAARHAADLLPVIAEIEAGGARSLREIAAELNGRKIPTAQGATWAAAQVRRVLMHRPD